MAQNPLNKVAVTVTIANGAADSDPIDCLELTLLGCVTPTGGMTNSALRFKASTDGATYVDLYNDDGTRYSIPVSTSAAQAISFNPAKLKPWRWAKLNMSGNETGAKTITVMTTGV